MAELGYREGRNLRLELRYAEYSAERATTLASEIAALKPAVIVANGGGIGPACRLTPPLPGRIPDQRRPGRRRLRE
jgi:hypothetical protein